MATKKQMQAADSQLLPFHGIVTVVLSGGVANLQASPSSLGPSMGRVLAEADSWAHFRWVSCKFRVHHGAMTGDLAAGFVGGAQDTLPATKPTIMELLPSIYYGTTYTKPSEWCTVSKSELAGPFPWYKSINGAADTTEEAPGYFVFAGTGTDNPVFEIKGVLEFKTSVATADTPLAKKLLAQLREERRLAAIGREREAVLKVFTPAASAKKDALP